MKVAVPPERLPTYADAIVEEPETAREDDVAAVNVAFVARRLVAERDAKNDDKAERNDV